MEIEKYEHVMHIVSEVGGRIKGEFISNECHCKFITHRYSIGAPKLRAIQRIYEAYPFKRGIYSGELASIVI